MFKVKNDKPENFNNPKNISEIVKIAIKYDCIELLEYMLECLSDSELKLLKKYEASNTQNSSNDNSNSSIVALTPEELKLIELIKHKQNYRRKELHARLVNDQYPLPKDLLKDANDNAEDYLNQLYGSLSHNTQIDGKDLLIYALNAGKLSSAALFLDLECYLYSTTKNELDKLVSSHYSSFEVMRNAIKEFLTQDVKPFVNDMREALSEYQDILDFRQMLPEALQKLFYDEKKSKERLYALIQIESELNWVSRSKRGAHHLYNSAKYLSQSSKGQKDESSQLFKRVKPLLEKAGTLIAYARLDFYNGKAFTPVETYLELQALKSQLQKDKSPVLLRIESEVEPKDEPKEPSLEVKKEEHKKDSTLSTATNLPSVSVPVIESNINVENTPTASENIVTDSATSLAMNIPTDPIASIEDVAKKTNEAEGMQPKIDIEPSTQTGESYRKIFADPKPDELLENYRQNAIKNGLESKVDVAVEPQTSNLSSPNVDKILDHKNSIFKPINIAFDYAKKCAALGAEALTTLPANKQKLQLAAEINGHLSVLCNNNVAFFYKINTGGNIPKDYINIVVALSEIKLDQKFPLQRTAVSESNLPIFENFKNGFLNYMKLNTITLGKLGGRVDYCLFTINIKKDDLPNATAIFKYFNIEYCGDFKQKLNNNPKPELPQGPSSELKSDNNNDNQDDTTPKNQN